MNPATQAEEIIRGRIAGSPVHGWLQDGTGCPCITFRDYMDLCLYHPSFGYYRGGKPRVGRDGDFYTSAHIGDIMGAQLAERLAAWARETFPDGGPVEAVDWGGGTGRLSLHMLEAWGRMGAEGARFSLTLVDGNPEHRRAAEESLAAYISAGRARVVSPDEAEREPWKLRRTAVVANELLDAFPVHRVTNRGGRLLEWAVAWRDTDGLTACLTEPSDPRLESWLQKQGVTLAEGQTTEIGLDGADWMARLADLLGEALVILIDYGDGTAELTGSHRMDGTLLAYENHRALGDPFRNPGGRDLTAHVDFDLIRARSREAGWRELWYGTQKRFLVETGVLSKLVDHGITDPFHPVARRNRAIRQLLLSDGMSELFKVQLLAK